MTLFRFLHISDLHVASIAERVGVLDLAGTGFDIDLVNHTSRASSHSRRMLRDLARLAWVEGEKIDRVIVTGDIATTGSNDDLRAAYRFLHTPYDNRGSFKGGQNPYLAVLDRPTLNNARNIKILLIPGNHDRYDGEFLLPGGKNFDTVFSRDWPAGQSACELDVLEKKGAYLAIIGGDLSLRKASDIESWRRLDQIWGAGKAHYDVLKEMERKTNDVREEFSGVAVVWLVHFPPKFQRGSKSLKLLDEMDLVLAAQRAGVSVLLCGHTHRERFYTIAGTSVYCAGSATQYLPPYSSEQRTVHFLELTVSASRGCSIKKETLIWSEERSVFER